MVQKSVRLQATVYPPADGYDCIRVATAVIESCSSKHVVRCWHEHESSDVSRVLNHVGLPYILNTAVMELFINSPL